MTDAPPHDCKTTLNIDIYLSTLVFLENIGHNYNFEGMGWSLVGSGGGGGGPDPKKTIHIYLQSMFRLSFQSNNMLGTILLT